MAYKDRFKIGDVISSEHDINKATANMNLLEIIGYKNIANIFHLKLKSLRTNHITEYPAMYADANYINYGKREVVELLWIKK